MGQLGFFDADKRLAALSAKGDPLEAIDGTCGSSRLQQGCGISVRCRRTSLTVH